MVQIKKNTMQKLSHLSQCDVIVINGKMKYNRDKVNELTENVKQL
jgi:tartrate dehydratase beta subunit/fumarate hydratase class I family protein